MSSEEPVVDIESAVPAGYKYVRSGNVYITKNCRALTHQAGRTVYVVRDSQKRACGIRVPIHVWKSVLKLNTETRDQRREAVRKRDTALENKVKTEILHRFPRIPPDRIQTIVKHMLIKRSGRVGRSKDMGLHDMVKLGVIAHIRHKDTDYDVLLRQGVPREVARTQVQQKINEKVKSWSSTSSKATKGNKKQKSSVVIKKISAKPARRASLRLKRMNESSKKSVDFLGEPMDID